MLASRSPRRAELLATGGFEYDVFPVDIDESWLPNEDPKEYVTRLAETKAAAAFRHYPDRVILAADTVVVLDGELLRKPVDNVEAAATLRRLSGTTHEVLTGVVVRLGNNRVSDVDVTRVRFVELTDEVINWYVLSGESDGKAGSYAIQGLASRFIDRIEGSYTNVVGLPVSMVNRLFQELTTS